MRAELLAERLGQAFRFKVFLLPAHRTASMKIAAALCAGGRFPESSESKPLVAGVAGPTDAGRARSDVSDPQMEVRIAPTAPIQKFRCQNHIDKHNANMKTHILPKRSPSDSSASQQDAGKKFAKKDPEPHSEPHVGEEAAKETCVPRCLARSRD